MQIPRDEVYLSLKLCRRGNYFVKAYLVAEIFSGVLFVLCVCVCVSLRTLYKVKGQTF